MQQSKCCVLPLDDTPILKCGLYSKLRQNFRRSLELVGWIIGFEPMVSSATNWRFNQLSYTHHIYQRTKANRLNINFMRCGTLKGIRTPDPLLRRQMLYPTELSALERVMGIEPTRPAWKAGVLPLNYTRIFMPLF